MLHMLSADQLKEIATKTDDSAGIEDAINEMLAQKQSKEKETEVE